MKIFENNGIQCIFKYINIFVINKNVDLLFQMLMISFNHLKIQHYFSIVNLFSYQLISSLSLQGITTSRFVGIYLSQVEQWIQILSLISDVIRIWIIVQQKWLYLENIFLSSNLQFGKESKQFEIIDKLYRKIMFGEIYSFLLN